MAEDFRITFFFGPDEKTDSPDVLVCVFNVKKRSWKGGVQIGVDLSRTQLARLADQSQLDELLEMIRAKVEPNQFDDYQQRARDFFTQQVCLTKLNLGIEKGITQENQTIPVHIMEKELDRAVVARADTIRSAILTELDL